MLAVMEVGPTEPTGDCRAEGGSEGRNEAGDEGGAANGIRITGGWVAFSDGGAAILLDGGWGSGTRTACPIF